MIDPAAIYYESTVISWNAIIIGASLIAACGLTYALYVSCHRFGIAACFYWAAAVVVSVYLSRIIDWYCRMEQYESFSSAVRQLDSGGYSMLGIVAGSWLAAVLFSALRIVRSRDEILDAAAPGIAYVMAMVRFSDAFTGACLGKNQFPDKAGFFYHTSENGGLTETRLAVYNISFLWLLFVGFLCLVLFLAGKRKIYRIFLSLFCVSEILVDSMRYDSLHLVFYGSPLLELNKVAGFMGLAQLISGLILIGYMIGSRIRLGKQGDTGDHKLKRKRIIVTALRWFVFMAGLAAVGVSEYLVQRYTAGYIRWYAMQMTGSLMMGMSVLAAEKTGEKNRKKS